jgi:hypothetical protein
VSEIGARHLDEARRYRFGPLDRAGWLLGLAAPQCVVLGVALLLAGVVLHATGSILAAGLPVAIGLVGAFARWDARPLYDWRSPMLGWLLLRHRHQDRWGARVRLLPGDAGGRPGLPPCLDGLELWEVPWRWARGPRPDGLGVVTDRSHLTFSATLRVRGREFALLERQDQEQVLDSWGAALGGFCRERTAVTRITWSEWAAPASLDEHLAFIREHQPPTNHNGSTNGVTREMPGGLDAYLDLVGTAGPLTTAHEVLVTLSVDRRRVNRGQAGDPDQAGIDALGEELRLFTSRLEQSGLVVDAPLSAQELALVLRTRLDPSCARRLSDRTRHLDEGDAVVGPHNFAPIAVQTRWREVQIDQAWHRSFWIAEWPRLEVPADWLAGVLLHPGGIRHLCVVFEPVAPSRSRRAIDRDATRLASDEDQRARRGFRIRAQHRRAESEVLAREAELVAGYGEFTYAGFLTITAFDLESLDDQSRDWEQVCAQAGLELRALDGQHDLGVTVGLPAGRGLKAPGRK